MHTVVLVEYEEGLFAVFCFVNISIVYAVCQIYICKSRVN